MSYHELTSGYPWLTKRVARILHPEVEPPRRNGFAYLFAVFTPYVGRGGGAAGLVVLLALIAVLATVGIPAYKDYEARSRLTLAYTSSEPARRALAAYYATNKKVPDSLETAGIPATLADGSQLTLDAETMVLTVDSAQGQLVFTPDERSEGVVTWHCSAGEGVRSAQLPSAWLCGASISGRAEMSTSAAFAAASILARGPIRIGAIRPRFAACTAASIELRSHGCTTAVGVGGSVLQ